MRFMQKPELLAPAGNLEKLKVALDYGADAFYLGMPPFSMRGRTNNFMTEQLVSGAEMIRKAGKTFYVTANIYPRGGKIDAFKNHIKFLRENVKPDAVIVADAGVFEIFREFYPEVALHMSVQANLLNYKAVEFWYKQGATRVILPRELTLEEIRQIHKKVPRVELEFFVHGAICMAFSGRCLLSNYMTGRDSNQGMCAHSCRWEYKVHDELSREERIAQLNNEDEKGAFYLEEAKRPGEFMKVEEDEEGTYFMNSKDMCAIDLLEDLWKAGVCSFKIEGRNKTEYYLATVVKAYRKAIDDMVAGKKFDKNLLEEIQKTSNRGFIPGFLPGFNAGGGSVSLFSRDEWKPGILFAGIVIGKVQGKKDLYEVEIRNRLERGREIEIMTPNSLKKMKLEKMFDLEGAEIEIAHGGTGRKILKLVPGLKENTMVRVRVG